MFEVLFSRGLPRHIIANSNGRPGLPKTRSLQSTYFLWESQNGRLGL
jgi:hypothetical protein